MIGSCCVERPLVDDVVQPPADERRDGDDDHAVADELRVLAAAARLADEHEVDRREADGVADPVPVDGERADLERDRVRGDVDHRRGGVYVAGRPRPRCAGGSIAVSPYTGPRMTSSLPPRSAADAVNAEFNWWLLIVGLVSARR